MADQKLHNQTLGTPSGDDRFAFGNPTTPAVGAFNVKFSELKNLVRPPIQLSKSFDVASLNIETEDLLGDGWNRNSLIYTGPDRDVIEAKLYVKNIGSNPNLCKVNIVVNGNDLYSVSAGYQLATGLNTIPVDQNLALVEGDNVQLAVRTATGSGDCLEGEFIITVE